MNIEEYPRPQNKVVLPDVCLELLHKSVVDGQGFDLTPDEFESLTNFISQSLVARVCELAIIEEMFRGNISVSSDDDSGWHFAVLDEQKIINSPKYDEIPGLSNTYERHGGIWDLVNAFVMDQKSHGYHTDMFELASLVDWIEETLPELKKFLGFAMGKYLIARTPEGWYFSPRATKIPQ